MGRSAGFAPLSILSTYSIARPAISSVFGPKEISPPARAQAPQPPAKGRRFVFAKSTMRGIQHRMPRRYNVKSVGSGIAHRAQRTFKIAGPPHFHGLQLDVERLGGPLGFWQFVIRMLGIP